MKKAPNIFSFRFADFGATKQRRSFEERKCRSRSCGHPKVIISWLNSPYDDWAVVVAAGRLTEEQYNAFLDLARRYAVIDLKSRRFFWPREKVNRIFK